MATPWLLSISFYLTTKHGRSMKKETDSEINSGIWWKSLQQKTARTRIKLSCCFQIECMCAAKYAVINV